MTEAPAGEQTLLSADVSSQVTLCARWSSATAVRPEFLSMLILSMDVLSRCDLFSGKVPTHLEDWRPIKPVP